jgi:hypothetical protein
MIRARTASRWAVVPARTRRSSSARCGLSSTIWTLGRPRGPTCSLDHYHCPRFQPTFPLTPPQSAWCLFSRRDQRVGPLDQSKSPKNDGGSDADHPVHATSLRLCSATGRTHVAPVWPPRSKKRPLPLFFRPKPRSQIPDDRLTARRQDDASPAVELRDWHSIHRRFDGMAPDLARALRPISLRRGLQWIIPRSSTGPRQ